MSGRPLDREEYIEQAYCFRTFRERLEDNTPAQEILRSLSEELLATTNLPKAIDFLRGEILHAGRISPGMARLAHYFTPFQTYVMSRAEEERSHFDQKTALLALRRQAEYLAGAPSPAGLFIYQFECIARNRLGYDRGMKAISDDPFFDKTWCDWILKARLRLGTTDFGQLIYYRSEQYLAEAQTNAWLQAVVSNPLQRAGGADRQSEPGQGSALHVRGPAAANRPSGRASPACQGFGPFHSPRTRTAPAADRDAAQDPRF